MKKTTISILFFFVSLLGVYAQAPQLIGYQAVIKDKSGDVIQESTIGIKITILRGGELGDVVYEERRFIRTNSNGLISFSIGEDMNQSFGSIGNINWADGPFYLRCDWALDGTENYTLSSTSLIKSVPYALYAERISIDALPEWMRSETKPTYAYDEIHGAPSVPAMLSELDNDLGFITETDVRNLLGSSHTSADTLFVNSAAYRITNSDIERWNMLANQPSKDSTFANSPASTITREDIIRWNASSGGDMRQYKVSDFENDAKYVTEKDLNLSVLQLKENTSGMKSEFDSLSVSFKDTKLMFDSLSEKIKDLRVENKNLKTDILRLYSLVDDLVKGKSIDTASIVPPISDTNSILPPIPPLDYRKAKTNSYQFMTYAFNDAASVYRDVRGKDRIIYIVRHAERSSDTSKEGSLTTNGENQIRIAGANFVGGFAAPNDCYYGSTDFYRCKMTSYLIAQARGDSEIKSVDDVVNPVPVIAQYYFTSTSNWPEITRYYENNKEEVNVKATDMINELCKATAGKSFAWFTSHDFLTLILTEWATEQAISFSSPNWINYLSGVAVLVHPDGQWEVYPVKNLENGFNTDHNYANW